MSRFIQFGALVDADLGLASQTLDRIFAGIHTLSTALVEAQRQGTALPAGLAESIDGLNDEAFALSDAIGSTTHAELPHWLASAQSTQDSISMLAAQLELATGAGARRTAYLVGGGLALAVALAGSISYYAKKHGALRGLRGLRGLGRREGRASTRGNSNDGSPTRGNSNDHSPTKTSTRANTRGNITVTGGAGANANTTVHVHNGLKGWNLRAGR